MRFRQRVVRNLRPLLFGAAAVLAVSVPPVQLAERADALLLDLAMTFHRPPQPDDIVLVDINDTAWLSSLIEIAEGAHSRAVVTTVTQPPSSHVSGRVLGPTEIPIGGNVIRRTSWTHGGHIDFPADIDGVVRRFPGWLDDAHEMPSLPLTLLTELHMSPAELPATARIGFQDPERFRRIAPQHLFEHSGELTDRIVVAGRADARHATPVGSLATHELVAQAIASGSAGTIVSAGLAAVALPWAAVFACLAALIGGGQAARMRRWLPAATGLGTAAAAVAAVPLAHVWLPVAAPLTFLLTASGLLPAARRDPATAPPRVAAEPGEIAKALDAGKIERAWTLIGELEDTEANFDTLCDFAETLEGQGYLELAADTYHRAAVIDPRRRSVATKLVRSSRSTADLEKARAAADAADLPKRLGRYELLQPIGRGSAGMVWLAADERINRLVALKVLDLGEEYGPEALDEGLDRFHREAESAGRLSHANIVTIYDIGEQGPLAYIAMEYLMGRHLSHFTDPERLLPTGLVLELGAQLAEALDYAHGRNVVHRDIKPGNIMYDSVSGKVTITDFGIARLIDVHQTRTGVVLGTPSFMAPEQLEGKNVNRYTDLFALGVTIYELLTGRLPFLGASMTKLMFVIANEPHTPISALRADLPPLLDTVLDRALAKRPEDRYGRGNDMAAALRQAASQLV